MKKWMKWAIGGAASACVVVVIVVPCVLLIPEDGSPPTEPANPTEKPTIDPANKTTYTFDDLFGGEFGYKSLYPTWDKTDETNKQFLAYAENKIVIRNIEKHNDNIRTLINDQGEGKSTAYSVSPDNQFVFYRNDYKKVWRHSYTGSFVIYKIVEGNEDGTKVNVAGFPTDAMIHHMEWSPTGHNLAFIYKWDVYVITNLEDNNPAAVRVTNDGSENNVYNGIPDWVYEEEMISSNNVLYWSPDSTSFAYLKTNDENTQRVKYSMYGDAQYPETKTIAYPKAGTTNPTVELFVYDIAATKSDELAPQAFPTDGRGNFTNYYFSRLTWLDNSNCLVTWIDRPQTHSVGNKCTRNDGTTTWACSHGAGTQEEPTDGWVGSFGPFNIVWKTGASPNEYFTIYARANDDPEDGRWQIARVSADLSTKTWMTKTAYDIVGLYFYDEANDWLYFTAAAQEPRERHVFRVKGNAENVVEPACMTCELDKTYENRCGWITARFNEDKSIAVANCRGYWIPMTVYYTIDAEGNWQEKPTVLEDNKELEDKVATKKWPTKEYKTFKSDKYEKAYKYEIFKPSDFDPTKKYPLLIEVYAGPEFQSVTDIWTSGWATTHMVSDKDIIVASVDGRGSAYEGYKFMRQVYKKLGQMEPEDQTDFAKYLANMDWIDETNVAIWGWSYGGYATSHTLGLDGGATFKCGIAVAPLADWRLYDSMYAERYMGLPADNDEGYTDASIITAHDLNNFKKAEYVLIHGTADDNVHFQNAAEMEKALVEHDVDFDDFFYADQAHSINTGNGSKHIYRQLTIRMAQCLGRSDAVYPGLPAQESKQKL